MVYRLHLKRDASGCPALVLGWWWRVVFAVPGLFILGIGLSIGGLGFPGWVLSAASLAAAIYHESWCFDSSLGVPTVVSEVGLIVPAALRRIRRYSRSEFHRVVVRTRSQFGTGESLYRRTSLPAMVQRGFVQLCLESDNPDVQRLIIQTESLRNGSGLNALALELADALDLPLEHRESS